MRIVKSFNRRSQLRISTAMAALIAYLIGTIGYPLPMVADALVRHECQDHVCGCTPAARNSGQCCCSNANLQRRVVETVHVDKPGNSCDKQDSSDHAPETGSCCASKKKDASQEPTRTTSPKQEKSPNMSGTPSFDSVSGRLAASKVAAISAQSCRGVTMMWVALGAVFAPPAVIDLCASDLVTGQIAVVNQTAKSRSIRPSSPPPKQSS